MDRPPGRIEPWLISSWSAYTASVTSSPGNDAELSLQWPTSDVAGDGEPDFRDHQMMRRDKTIMNDATDAAMAAKETDY